jgi:hypothetical protein
LVSFGLASFGWSFSPSVLLPTASFFGIKPIVARRFSIDFGLSALSTIKERDKKIKNYSV